LVVFTNVCRINLAHDQLFAKATNLPPPIMGHFLPTRGNYAQETAHQRSRNSGKLTAATFMSIRSNA
jgi:hypothetical protein